MPSGRQHVGQRHIHHVRPPLFPLQPYSYKQTCLTIVDRALLCSCNVFFRYLRGIGLPQAWSQTIYPGDDSNDVDVKCDNIVYVRNCTQCYGNTQQPMCLLKKKNLFRDEKVSHWFPSFDTGLLIVYPQSSIINYQLPITLLMNFHVLVHQPPFDHLHHDQNDPGHDGRMLCSEKLL